MSQHHDRLTLPQIFEHALHFGQMSPDHRRKQQYNVRYYLEFLSRECGVDVTGPDAITWDEFQSGDYVEAYAEHLRARKLSTNTIRQYTNPIRLASRYMRRRHKAGTVEVQEYIPKRTRLLPKLYLTPVQLRTAIREARETENLTAELGFIVAGLAGLNLKEICYRCADDLEGDVLTIYDSKTEFRERIIPVPHIVATTLKRHFMIRAATPRVEDPRNALFANYEFLSKSMRRVLDRCAEKAADPDDREAFARVDPKGLRKTWDNLAATVGVPFGWKEGYFGHKVTLADGSESEANSYTAYRCTRADLPSVKKQVIANLRREVVERIEGAIKIYDLG